MRKNKNLISIIAPVKNEKDNIEWTIKNVKKIVKPKYEFIIVHDSKKDNTLGIARKLQKKDKSIHIINNHYKHGVLNAIKTGIMSARGEIIVVMAVDRTDDPKTINLMYKKILKGYDVVCPTRYSRGGKAIGKFTLKSVLSRISGVSTPYILGIPTSDLTYSFKMFRKKVIEDIDIKSKGGFEFAEELLIKAHFKKFKITEVPTLWIDRRYGKSKFKLASWLPKYIYWYLWGFSQRLKILTD